MITPSFSLTATERVLPRLALDFTTALLDNRITFTRTTGASNPATYVASNGYVTAATNNQPRFDYDPVTLLCKGLLIEESRANLLANSENIASLGVLANGAVNSDVAVSPSGATNADEFYENTAAGTHYAGNNFSFVSGTTYTLSVFAKKPTASTRWLRLLFPSSAFTTATSAIFNLSTGVIENQTNSPSAAIQSFGNGWYRCTITKAATVTAAGGLQIGLTNGLTASYTGDGTSGLYIWGAQLEAGAFATSYIPTTTTALTRNVDVATMTGTNFSDFWQDGKGGAMVQAIPSTVSGIRPLVQYDDGTANNIISLRGNAANPELQIVDGGAPQVQLDAGSIVVNTPYSLTGWWQENNSFAQLNTQASVRDNTVTIPTVTQARIGSDGTNYLNGHIATIDYYDELSNSIYDSLRLLGYTGTVTDMLLQYYLARGATSNSLTDAELEFLIAKGFTTGTVDDRWVNYLNSLGYVGTITDMKYLYWKSPE